MNGSFLFTSPNWNECLFKLYVSKDLTMDTIEALGVFCGEIANNVKYKFEL